MKCLVTETLSGKKDGVLTVRVNTLQTIEEVGLFDSIFMRVGKVCFTADTSSLSK